MSFEERARLEGGAGDVMAAMEVSDPPQEAQEDFEKPAQEEAAQEEAAHQEAAHQEAAQEAAQEEAAHQAGGAQADEPGEDALCAGVRTLMEDGWTAGELTAFSRDPQVQADVAAGMSVRQAARAYLVRGGERRRRGVPTLRAQATSGAGGASLVEQMSDEEFARFSDRAMELLREGRQVTIR